jgi:tyrosine-protein phosphatase YwqE
MSMTGHYGPQIKAASDYLIQHNMADVVGSDIHKPEHAHLIARLKHSESYAKIAEAIGRTNAMVR